MKLSLLALDAASYQSHALHRGERAWLETNCYVDLWIEVLHAHGHDPHAALAFTVAADFEGDQFLFFKQPLADLQLLYGVDVQELNIWRSVLEHVSVQLGRGRLVLLEVDAFYLPDTKGISYRSEHTKTTIGIETLELEHRRLGYFHNGGYYTLAGEDFEPLFGLGAAARPDALAPYTEFARFDRSHVLGSIELMERSRGLLQGYVARIPAENPIGRLRARFESDLAWLTEQPQPTFYAYAFSTLRQCGSCYELAASYLRWLGEQDRRALAPASEAFDTLAGQAKMLQFKVARAVVLKKQVDFAPMFEVMENAWVAAQRCLAGWATG